MKSKKQMLETEIDNLKVQMKQNVKVEMTLTIKAPIMKRNSL